MPACQYLASIKMGDHATFAEWLEQKRIEKGLSKVALAKMMDVNRETIRQWEDPAGHMPGDDRLSDLASALDVSIHEIVRRKRGAEVGQPTVAPEPEMNGLAVASRNVLFQLRDDDGSVRVRMEIVVSVAPPKEINLDLKY